MGLWTRLRQNQASAINAAVAAEAVLRAAADTTLTTNLATTQAEVDAEETARAAAVTAEATARAAADTTLTSNVAALAGDLATAVLTVGAEIGDTRTLSIQARDVYGVNLAEVVGIRVFLGTSQYGSVPGGSGVLTDNGAGSIVDGSGTSTVIAETDATGLLELLITDAAVETLYVAVGDAYLASGRQFLLPAKAQAQFT